MVTPPSTNWTRHRLTSLTEANALLVTTLVSVGMYVQDDARNDLNLIKVFVCCV